MILGGVTQAEEPDITEQSVFSFYKKLSLLTPAPLIVSARVAAACAPVSPPSAIAEEERRFGPHAEASINLYVNDAAKRAIEDESQRFPPGAVIVKEKLAPGGESMVAVGGMVKRAPGFDPANGDWEYFYAARSAGFTSGRLANCIACHAQAKSDDYVFPVPRKN